MTNVQVWYAIAVIVLVTALTRFLPFILLSNSKKTPKIITKLGNLLPYAIMGMLVVYCLKDIPPPPPREGRDHPAKGPAHIPFSLRNPDFCLWCT